MLPYRHLHWHVQNSRHSILFLAQLHLVHLELLQEHIATKCIIVCLPLIFAHRVHIVLCLSAIPILLDQKALDTSENTSSSSKKIAIPFIFSVKSFP